LGEINQNKKYIDNLSTFPELKNIYFLHKNNTFYFLDQQTKIFKQISSEDIRGILSNYIESSNLLKYFKNYLEQLKTINS